MSSLHPLIDFPVTQYYFDTFIVGSHHSVPHLIRDLLARKEIAESALEMEQYVYKRKELAKLIHLIDVKLSTLNINDVYLIEEFESVFWVNQLGRQSALEISTYGRIKPDTMNLLMCLTDDQFATAMNIAGKLSTKIQILGEHSLINSTPVPTAMPTVS